MPGERAVGMERERRRRKREEILGKIRNQMLLSSNPHNKRFILKTF
jgi:hypothetical protein